MYLLLLLSPCIPLSPKEEGLEETETDKVLRSHIFYIYVNMCVFLFFLIKIDIKLLIFSNYRLKKRKNNLKLLYRKSQCNLNAYAHQKKKK